MLSEPQSITLGRAGAQSASRVLNGTAKGEFVSPNGAARLEVQTTGGSRIRTVARVIENAIATDPLSSVQTRVGQTIALTINRPMDGFSEAEVLASVKGFIAWLSASSDANLKKIIAGEN